MEEKKQGEPLMKQNESLNGKTHQQYSQLKGTFKQNTEHNPHCETEAVQFATSDRVPWIAM